MFSQLDKSLKKNYPENCVRRARRHTVKFLEKRYVLEELKN